MLGSQGAGRSLISGILIEDNEDVVEVGTSEATEHGAMLRASTDWIEHHDAHGLEKFEPTRNVEILEVPGYEHPDDVSLYDFILHSFLCNWLWPSCDRFETAHPHIASIRISRRCYISVGS